MNKLYVLALAILNQSYLLSVCQKFDILCQFMKSSNAIADVNQAKNLLNVFFRFEIAIPNLRKYSSISNLAILSNLSNIFSRF